MIPSTATHQPISAKESPWAAICRIIIQPSTRNPVTVVHNGRQAVDLFQSSPAGTFDAILMDIMMPVMNGLDASRIIRGLDRLDVGRIPIIAMTANAFREDAEECFEAGMNAHLAKPLEMKKMTAVIARCCEQDREERR